MTQLTAQSSLRWIMAFGVAAAIGFLAVGLQTGPAVAGEAPVVNQSPDCSLAAPSKSVIKKHNKKFRKIRVLGITDPDGDDVTIDIFAIRQDEPVGVIKPGKKKKKQRAPDAIIVGDGKFKLRAERLGKGNGRVYHITVRATDEHGAICAAFLQVSVPKNKKKPAIDEGPLYDSTVPDPS